MQEIDFRVGWVIFWILAIIGILLLPWKTPLGLTILGINIIYLGTCLHELRSPVRGILYRRGVAMGILPAGWYLTLPHFWDIEEISEEYEEVEVSGLMYTKEKTPIEVKAKLFYQAVFNNLSLILLMKPSEMKEKRAPVLGLAALREVIGANFFGDLVSIKRELEEKVTLRLENEFTRYSYKLSDCEIYEFKETTWSEAEKIRAIGKARGDAAKALADSLKDNYPAAVVSIAETLGDKAKEITNIIYGGKKDKPTPETTAQKKDVGSKLNQAINKLIGGE